MATTEGLRKTEVRIGIGVIATLSVVLVLVFVLRLAGVQFTAEEAWPDPGVAGEPFLAETRRRAVKPSRKAEAPTELKPRAGFAPPPSGPADASSEWSSTNVAPRARPSSEPPLPDYVPRLAGLLHRRDPVASSNADEASGSENALGGPLADGRAPRDASGSANASALKRPAPADDLADNGSTGPAARQAAISEPAMDAENQPSDRRSPEPSAVAPAAPAPDTRDTSTDADHRYARGRSSSARVPRADPDPRPVEAPGAHTADRPDRRQRRPPVILRGHTKSSPETTRERGRRRLRPYVVRRGDTLFDIARAELGDGSRWPEIFRLNRETLGDNYNRLLPGTRLHVPGGYDHAVSLKREPVRIIR